MSFGGALDTRRDPARAGGCPPCSEPVQGWASGSKGPGGGGVDRHLSLGEPWCTPRPHPRGRKVLGSHRRGRKHRQLLRDRVHFVRAPHLVPLPPPLQPPAAPLAFVNGRLIFSKDGGSKTACVTCVWFGGIPSTRGKKAKGETQWAWEVAGTRVLRPRRPSRPSSTK